MKWLCIGLVEGHEEFYDYDFIEGTEDDAETRAFNLARSVIEPNELLTAEIESWVEEEIEEHPSLAWERDSLYFDRLEDMCEIEIYRLKDDSDLAELGKMELSLKDFIKRFTIEESI